MIAMMATKPWLIMALLYASRQYINQILQSNLHYVPASHDVQCPPQQCKDYSGSIEWKWSVKNVLLYYYSR
jgi:hypothetical protein